MSNILVGICFEVTEPFDVLSEGNIVSIGFQTNGNISGRGFRLEYKIRKLMQTHNLLFYFKQSRITLAAVACLASVSVVGPGNFSTPNFPDNYDNNEQCVVVLATIPGRRMNIQFTDFDLEPSDTCFEKDYVQVCSAH